MEPITLAALAAGAYFLTRNKKAQVPSGAGGGAGDSAVTVPPSVSGIPNIFTKRLWINRAFDTVKFELQFPNGQEEEFKLKLNKGNIQQRVGNYWLMTKTEPATTKKGDVDPFGLVNIALMNSNKTKVLRAISVVMDTKNIIDIK